jgi:photosystem II stability/assembly factor-like uncharacterized protein
MNKAPTSTSGLPVTKVPASPLPMVNSASIWQVSAAYPAAMEVADLSCPSVSTCFAAGRSSSQGGEVLKSVNTGVTWKTETLPSGAAAIASISCPSVSVCLATENQSVLMTHDSGKEWTLLNTPQGSTVADIACPSITICYAVGQNSRGNPYILETTDSGTTWTPANLVANGFALEGFSGLTGISCPSRTVCYAIGGGEYLVTEDSGAIWTIGAGLVNGAGAQGGGGGLGPYGTTIACPSTTMCVTNGTTNVGSGAIPSGILVTTDAGRRWVSERLPLRMGVFGFSCPATRVCFAIGAGGYGYGPHEFAAILSSTDAGRSWRTRLDIQGPGINEIACSTTSTCVAGEEDGDTVNVTTDSGSTWTTRAFPPGLGVGEVTCPSTSVCYVTASNGILATADSGDTWAVRALPSDNSPIAISCPSPTACFVIAQTSNRHNDFLSTIDSGHTWSIIHTWPIVAGLSPFELTCPAATTCYAVANADIEQTINSGRAWRTAVLAGSGYRGLDSIACPLPTTCYATGTSEIIATRGPGASWTAQGVPDGTEPVLTGIACTSPTTCVAVGQDSNCYDEGDDPCPAGTLAVLATNNGGEDWSGYAIPPDINLNAVACLSDGHCYALAFDGTADGYIGGGEGSVLASSDFGATWSSQTVPAGTGGLTSVSCPSTTTCYAVGEGTGDVGGLILKASNL